MSKENLNAIIAMLLASSTKTSRTLSRGLVLAYTPGSENGGVFRFTISRKDISPSDKEAEIVERELKNALQKQSRPWAFWSYQPWLKKRAARAVYQYHLWQWQEPVQEKLI